MCIVEKLVIIQSNYNCNKEMFVPAYNQYFFKRYNEKTNIMTFQTNSTKFCKISISEENNPLLYFKTYRSFIHIKGMLTNADYIQSTNDRHFFV